MTFDRPDADPSGEDKEHRTPLDNADINGKLVELLTLWVLFLRMSLSQTAAYVCMT
ncbi:hypothetical protein HFO38_17170 [Rhizobium leguminosarum]|uniref:hypothetical protein n=1 Tax=Rhizobium leguminosarum TaxID=384 RepID=UPI001C950835|nr:hypothetical protein [Rhizobium leguminosarum]MBY5704430.1 hypothetical protein [Rhizobium leguminosarum]